MKKIDDRIVRYLKKKAPTFIEICQEVKEGKADMVIVTIDAFADEPQFLYDILLYANSEGVPVEFAPEDQTSDGKN